MSSVLLNASTLTKGGALQVCVNLLEKMQGDHSIDWYFALSAQVDDERCRMGVELDRRRVHRIDSSPSKSRAARTRIARLSEELSIDAVFTLFGPAYVGFPKPHLLGVADPWVTHAGWVAYANLKRLSEYLRKPALAVYKGLWYRRADAWVVEAEAAREGLHRRWGLPLDRIDVVPNNCGAHYLAHPFTSLPRAPAGEVDVLTLSAYYPHKLLELVPAVAAVLARGAYAGRFRFHLTLPESGAGWRRVEALARRLGVRDQLVNHGPVAVADGPALYERCHVMFLPTLLETFSASYPEAMAAGRPIVTSDLPFARSNCGDAALYFRAADATAAARALVALVEQPAVWAGLVAAGRKRLGELPDPDAKYRLYVAALTKMLARHAAAARQPELANGRRP